MPRSRKSLYLLSSAKYGMRLVTWATAWRFGDAGKAESKFRRGFFPKLYLRAASAKSHLYSGEWASPRLPSDVEADHTLGLIRWSGGLGRRYLIAEFVIHQSKSVTIYRPVSASFKYSGVMEQEGIRFKGSNWQIFALSSFDRRLIASLRLREWLPYR